jgi:hypothetical protein
VKGLDVAGPAYTFITLGAVCGDRYKVSSHGPHGVFVKLVDKRVRTLEGTSAVKIRGNHDGGEIIEGKSVISAVSWPAGRAQS